MSKGTILLLARYRLLISRMVLGYAFLFLLVRWAEHLLPYQLLQPPMARTGYDMTAWFFKLSGLSWWLVENPLGAKAFTVLLLLSGLLAFCFPKERWFVIPFSIFYFFYSVCFNLYLTHAAHLNAMMVWALFACWPRKDTDFAWLWLGFRYYACWAFGSTFLMKLVNGAFWQWDFGLLATQANQADFLFHFPDTWQADVYSWLFRHPFLLNLGAKILMLAEGCFIIGFFTRGADRLLLVLAFFILLLTFLFAEVFFAEMLVMVLAFFPLRWWARLWLLTTPGSIHKFFTSS